MGSVDERLVHDTMSCIKPGTRGPCGRGVPGDSGWGHWALVGPWGLGGFLETGGSLGVPGNSLSWGGGGAVPSGVPVDSGHAWGLGSLW